jgi:hypothetical protein
MGSTSSPMLSGRFQLAHRHPPRLPATVTVPAGQQTATFTITTSLVYGQEGAAIAASGSAGAAVYTVLTINAPPIASGTLTDLPATLQSITLNLTQVECGKPVTGTATLSGPAGADFVVTLSSNQAAADLPRSMQIGTGHTSATFDIGTSVLTIDPPPALVSFTINPSISAICSTSAFPDL